MNPDLLLFAGKKNRSKHLSVLKAVFDHPGISRSALCGETRISKNHITLLVKELLQSGVLEEHETSPTAGSGRPAIGLTVFPKLFFTLGINLSAEHSEVILLDASCQVVEKMPLLQQGKRPALLLELRQKCSYFLRQYSPEKILCAGIAVPGIADCSNGIIKYSSAFGAGEQVELKKFFKEELDLDITLINTSHILPIMEKLYGSARKLDTFVTIDEGLGCGMYLQGRLYRGWQNACGEIGHMKIQDTSVVNSDGRTGVLMDMSLFNLVGERALALIRQGEKIDLEWTGKPNEYIKPNAIVRAVENQDCFIKQQLTEIFSYLGDAVVNVAYLLNPEVIYLPEWTSKVPECTVDVVRKKLHNYGLPEWGLQTKVLSMQCSRKRMAEAVAVFATEKFLKKNAQL